MKKSLIFLIILLIQIPAFAETGFTLRGTLGTDIGGGLGFGVGGRFYHKAGFGHLEFGPDLIVSSTEETTEEFHTYIENTDLVVFAARINNLINYTPGKRGTYYLYGTGAAALSVEWTEESPTDTSLGTPRAGGGSMQSEDGTAFALIANFGVGFTRPGNLDFRIETPILISLNEVGEAATFIPTLTVGFGFSF